MIMMKKLSVFALLSLSLSALGQVPCTGSVMRIGDQTGQAKSKINFQMTKNDEYFMEAKANVEELNMTVAVNISNLISTGRIISRQKNSELISTTSGSLISGLVHTVQDDENFLLITCKK
jgi:hypothetical protein